MIRIALRSAAIAALTALATVAAIIADFTWTAQAQDGGASEVEGRIVVRPWVDDDGELTRVEFGFRPGWGEDVRGGGDGPDDLFPPKRFLTQRLIDGSAGRWLRSSEILIPNAEGSEEGVRGRIIARAEVDDDGELSRIGFGFRPAWGEDVRGEESGADDIFPTNRFLTRRLIDNSAGKWLRSSLISVPAERPEETTEPSEGAANETGEVGVDGGSATAADGATIVVPAGAAAEGAEITARVVPEEELPPLPPGGTERLGTWDFEVEGGLTGEVTLSLPLPADEDETWFLGHYDGEHWYVEPFRVEDGMIIVQIDSLSILDRIKGIPIVGDVVQGYEYVGRKIVTGVKKLGEIYWDLNTLAVDWLAEELGLIEPVVCNSPDDSVDVTNPTGGGLVGIYLKGCAQQTANGPLLLARNPRHIWFEVRPIAGDAEHATSPDLYKWLSSHDEGTLLAPGAIGDWRPTRDGIVRLNAEMTWTAAGMTWFYDPLKEMIEAIVEFAVPTSTLTNLVSVLLRSEELTQALAQWNRGNRGAAVRTAAGVIGSTVMRDALIDLIVTAVERTGRAIPKKALIKAYAVYKVGEILVKRVQAGIEFFKVLVANDEDRLGTVAYTVPYSVCWGRDVTEGAVSGRWNRACQSERLDGSYARYHRFTLDEAQEVTLALNSSLSAAVYILPGTIRTLRPVMSTTDASDSIRRELEAGVYTIEVATRGAGRTGTFELRVELAGAQDDEPDEGNEQPAVGESRFSAVSAGGHHTCGLRETGAVGCWGYNEDGQTDAPTGRFSAVSAGYRHTCGLRETGAVECWGYNGSGQTDAPAGRFSAVSAGSWHTCGLRETGAVECWGYNGSGETDAPAGRFSAVSAGGTHTCGLRETGAVECWGDSDAPEGNFTAVSASDWYPCGLLTNGEIKCWNKGTGWDGAIDAPEGKFATVSTGNYFNCALRDDGELECWTNYWDFEGWLHPIPNPQGHYTAVSAGTTHVCAIREGNREIACWGASGRSWGYVAAADDSHAAGGDDAPGETTPAVQSIQPPQIDRIRCSPSSPRVGEDVVCTARLSGGSPTSYSWSGGSSGGSDATYLTRFNSPGTRTVRLTVSNDGGSDSASTRVTVRARDPEPPQIRITCPAYTETGRNISCTARNWGGPVDTWEWGASGGALGGSSETYSVWFSSFGRNVVRLTASNAGGSDSATRSVEVVAAPPSSQYSRCGTDAIKVYWFDRANFRKHHVDMTGEEATRILGASWWATIGYLSQPACDSWPTGGPRTAEDYR